MSLFATIIVDITVLQRETQYVAHVVHVVYGLNTE